MTVGGVIGNGTGNGLIYAGNGTLILNGASTYTGTTEIQSGLTVTAGNVQAFGATTSGPITIDNGAMLNVNGIALNNIASKLISISGTGVGGNGAIRAISAPPEPARTTSPTSRSPATPPSAEQCDGISVAAESSNSTATP